ncbi:hypothetical protein HA402_008587, partial [Bradysia odoriphaga]
GYFLGSSHGEYGDSGAGIFDKGGRFIGISVGKKRFIIASPQDGAKIDLESLADHHPTTQIISADNIFFALGIHDPS